MRTLFFILVASFAFIDASFAQEVIYRNTLDEQSVETDDLFIGLDSVDDDVRFSITLTNTETGFTRRHEFDGQGASDPSPYLLEYRYNCGVDVILLTVEYPWRHALPMYVRVLETFAFRESDFEFIDVAIGPPSDIALMDSSDPESDNLRMQPPTLVECLPEGSSTPFRFVDNPMDR